MSRIPSVMTAQQRFAQVPQAEIPRSSFDRSHGHKTTFYAGQLIPVFVDEALPGDTFALNMTAFARLATPLHPFMDNLFLNSFFFAVPIRLIWENWERFNGAQDDPGDSTDFLVPQIVAPTGGFQAGSIYDYFGLPTGVGGISVSAFWARAYNLIWNEWFRDQNLQDSLTIDRSDGPDNASTFALRRRGKRHDYFTSALPWPQKGDSVDLPLGSQATVLTNATGFTDLTGAGTGPHNPIIYNTTGTNPASPGAGSLQTNSSGGSSHTGGAGSSTGVFPVNLYADLTNATAATINQLRQAFQIQKLLERDARGGTRYTEIIRAHFGVTSPDARLQRPEYLGGGSSPINVSPIAQTSETDAGTPLATLAGIGTANLVNHGFTQSFTEHGVIIGLVNVRADLTYQQGIDRMWSRQTRYDFYWPALAHIGEQAILNKEIYATGEATDEDVFAYQERFAEYRYKPSRIMGLFRSDATGTLDAWHLAQDFSALPTLGDTFIQDDPPFDRVIAVPAEPHFLFDSFFSLRCARPMPLYGVPGLIDHF